MTDGPEHKKPETTLEWLNQQVDIFLANNPSVTAEGFGWMSIKDASLVARLRKGGDVTTRKLDGIVAFLRNPTRSKPHVMEKKNEESHLGAAER